MSDFLEKKVDTIILTKLFINLNEFSCVNQVFNVKVNLPDSTFRTTFLIFGAC